MMLAQILDVIDIGLLILDKDCKVRYWNRWLASHSGIPAQRIKGGSLFDFFPHLNNKKFLRNFQAILAFGNCYFFPQKLYDYIFPFKPVSNFANEVDYMQQNCVMGPLRNEKKEIEFVYVTVKDVTEPHIYETKLTSALFSLLEKNVAQGEVPPPVQSVLSELLSTHSGDKFLARYAPSQKDQKNINAAIEAQIDEIFSVITRK